MTTVASPADLLAPLWDSPQIDGPANLPSAHPAHVQRTGLVQRLARSAEPLIAVTAPAGYGKTTLLVEWAASDPRRTVWVTLDESDADIAHLVAKLLTGLQDLISPEHRPLPLPTSAEPLLSLSVLPGLANALASPADPFVLVLDDVHRIGDGSAAQVIDVLVDSIPPGSQLAMTTRTTLPGRPSRWRVQGRLLELGVDDLAMDRLEARQLFEAAGATSDPVTVDLALTRTEGWPFGLYLAARATAVGAPVPDGTDHAIGSYLRDEVLRDVDDDVAWFMLRCSVLDELSGSLCHSVTGDPAAGDRLRRLAESNLLVVPLDRTDTWYRFHHLLQDQLRAELQRRDATSIAELQLRASHWFEAHNQPELAISHAAAAGDVTRAAELLWERAADLVGSGATDLLRRWIPRFTDRQISDDPRLALIAAWLAVHDGDTLALQRFVVSAAAAARRNRDQSLAPALMLLRAVTGSQGLEQMRIDAERSAELEPPTSKWRPISLFLEGKALAFGGARLEGRRRIDAAATLSAELELPLVQARCLTELGLMSVHDGDHEAGHDLIRRARALALTCRGEDIATAAAIFAASAWLLALQAPGPKAHNELNTATRLTSLVAQITAWPAVEATLLLAKAHVLLGQREAARQRLSEARALSGAISDSLSMLDELTRTAALVDAMTEPDAAELPTLTAAELRVLQFLPSHLSFPEIGAQLHLSKHTVKSQALASYRKLGVTSRSEAVARATDLGWLPRGVTTRS